MSLADRLAQARRSRDAEAQPTTPSLEPHLHAARRSADPFADLKRTVHTSLLESLGPQLYDAKFTQADLEQKVRHTLHEVLAQEETPLSVADRARIAQEIADDILGYGPLEPFLRDPEITEIMVNGHDQLYVERAGKLHPVTATFVDEAHLRRTIDKIVAQVGRINGLVAEMAASTQEQATGLNQVNSAVNQMDQVTQQNAAMVEQSTAASHALAGEADQLQRLISQFRVGGAAAPARHAAPPRKLQMAG